MFELITLSLDGRPETDWTVLPKKYAYAKRNYAARKMYSLLASGLYKAVIVRDVVLQPDRDDIIRETNKNLNCPDYIILRNQLTLQGRM